MTTAFVLSGGANLGAVQVGMLAAISDLGIAPDLMVGTSAGALNAAYLAGHGTDHATIDELAAVWRGLRTWRLFRPDPLRLATGMIGRSPSMFGAGGLHDLLHQHLTFDRLEDAGVPLVVITTDLLTGEEVSLTSGPAIEAILASSAIPGMLPPVPREGHTLVDGGLADNTAISQAVAAGADTLYVLPCGYPCALTEPPTSALGTVLQAMTLLVHQRLLHDIALYADRAELIVLPPPCPLAVGPLDFGRADELIERSRDAARAFLAVDGGRRKNPAAHIAMHTHPRP